MSRGGCFLCAKRKDGLIVMETCQVLASEKPVQVVLQHLANCIKTTLVFPKGASICKDCYKQLVEYDKLMLKLLTQQKRLTKQLQNALNCRMEFIAEDAEMEELTVVLGEDGQLADAFNPELDAKEELVEVDDQVIEEFIVDEDEEHDMNDQTDLDGEEEEDDEESDDGRMRNECVVCGATFKSRFLLQSHINESHSSSTHNYVCSVCGVVRRDEEYLELHMNLHEGKTENECRYCPKRFSRPVNTLRHMRMHWDRKKYQCEKCGERFSQDNLLYNHRLRHEAEENPLICSICNQSFKSRKTYNHHILIHQEDRPRHHCTICSKSFTERYTLKVHMKTHGEEAVAAAAAAAAEHSQELMNVLVDSSMVPMAEHEEELHETEAAVTALVEEVDEPGIFGCVICTVKFENKELLEQHLQSAHDVILK